MKKIFLHIGTAKTGTTAIQQFLADNSERLLADHSILYPLTGRQWYKKTRQRSEAHHRLALDYYRDNDPQRSKIVTSFVHQLCEEITKSSADIFVISSEYFPGSTGDEIDRHYLEPLAKIADVYTIMYIRRQDELLDSWYAQSVKRYKSTPPTPDTLYRRLKSRGVLDYFELANIWGGAKFGLDHVHVRPYERDQLKNRDTIADFMSLLGIESIDHYERRPGISNPSISRDQMLIINALHGAGMRDNLTKNLRDPFVDVPTKDSRFVLSPARRQEIIDEYAESNRRVASEYLSRDNEPLFSSPSPFDRTPNWKPKRQPDLKFLMRAIGHLIDDSIADLESELATTQDQLKDALVRLEKLERGAKADPNDRR